MANYDTFIFAGHGTSEKDGSYDPGAVSNGVREHDIAKKIATKATEYLTKNGYRVHLDEQNYIDNDVAGNTYRLKFGFSIHLNASNGQGRGAECYIPLNEGYCVVEQNILNDLATLGLVNRGIKSRNYYTEEYSQRYNGMKLSGTDYYKEIREAWKLGISLSILEVGFIDSADLTIVNNNIDKIAFFIARAIMQEDGKTLAEDSKPTAPTTPAPSKPQVYYRVVCGSFENRDSAEKRKSELLKLGYDSFLQVYEK